MALDPRIAQLIEWTRRAGRENYARMTPQAAREHYARAVRTLDIAPIPMAEIHDHRLELGERSLVLRQYAPRALSWFDPLPGLLFFHGGGFTIGSIDTHDRVCRAYADASAALARALGTRPKH